MSENLLISRKSLAEKAKMKIAEGKMPALNMVDFCKPVISGKTAMSQDQLFEKIDKMADASMIGSNFRTTLQVSGKYGSGFDIPVKWGDESVMSTREKLSTGHFSTSMSSNTLPVDWQNLWDAMRIDVTVRKAALPTIREFIYNITTDPNFTRDINPTEINAFGVVFEENDGHGQAVPQGETRGGGYDTFKILIYSAGFTWDLMASLFDRTITPERVMDAVMVGYNSLKDDLAISPILDFTYAGVQQTAAAVLSGANRQELLYLTLENAVDDLGDRNNPATDRDLDVSNVVVLAHPYDARHIARVANGLPSTNERVYSGISEISNVISYDSEVIRLRDRTVTYTGVTKGTAYMIIPASSLEQGYMEIAVKRDLVVEVDEQPDVKTLTQEQRAYWFAEGLWDEGIQYFIQEITLPVW
jgi:hypothetical protein